MRRLRLYARLTRLLLVLAAGAALAASVSLLEKVGRTQKLALRQRLSRRFMGWLSAALPFRVRLSGEKPQQPMLWVANHVSWTDIPLLGQLLPLSFLSKAEVRNWPLAGWLAERAGTLFIRRGAGDGLLLNRQIAERLQDGCPLLVFPEGTSTTGESVRAFHGRLLGGAIEAGVALQPVAVRYRRNGELDPLAPFVGDDELTEHLLRLLEADVGEVHIQLLPPIETRDGERSALARQARAAIETALNGTDEQIEQAA
ncbi:lysophospholipid acyltransferase family protein [Pseudomonas mangrovi]|uniref:1-acyl-sn-glycerol-3-phosphate acyltransferase n=1 Tax=Pseudomonas mangrovi TaxID=2161748 RepID=A0A2T5PEQ6_9PSED|nr:lysophospholipid acyltransferase family protein [Pseudomonas mangrovi]PTU76203.1 1-acyl-sn-glycerol-3-phosphate acyltransferase [Pseudomonas mangrovi]